MHYLDDLASDFSVYHGVRDIRKLQSRTFMSLAMRIGAYGGAFSASLRKRKEAEQRPGSKAAAMPVATAAELRNLLSYVPGAGMWGTVAEVKTEGGGT